MDSLLTGLSEAFGPLILLFGGLFAFAESAFGLGFFVPGETAVLALGAATGSAEQLTAAMVTVAVGAMAGDHTGYLLGRRYGARLRESRVVRRIGPKHWDRATGLLRRHGVLALIISRLLPAVRTLMPAAAGAADVSYGRFLAGSVVGAGLWSGLWTGMGAAARATLPQMADTLGMAGWIAFGVVALVVATLLVWRRYTRRNRAAAQDAASAELESCEVR